MNIKSLTLAAALSLFAGTAFAACPDTSASVDSGQTAGISKDGSLAPLQLPEAGAPAAKDGKTMPLASQEGGGDKNLATSEQDVVAQQQGDLTAAAKADDACKE